MRRLIFLALAFMLLAGVAEAACPTTSLTFKDAAGATQTLCFGGASGAFIPQYQIIDAAGTNVLTITAAGAAKVDGSGATQPVSGTVTANAGTNLNTSALALDTSVNGLLLAQGSTTSGQKGPLLIGAVTTAAPSYTTAQSSPLSLTTAGALRVDGSGSTQPVSGTVTATTNITQISGSAVATAASGIMKVGVTDATGNALASVASALEVNLRSSSGTEAGTMANPIIVTVGGNSAGGSTAVNDTIQDSTVNPFAKVQNINISSMSPLFSLSTSLDRISGQPIFIGSQLSARSLSVVVASDQTVNITGTVQGVSGGTPIPDNLAQIANNPVTTAGVTGTLAVGGNQAGGAVISTNTFPMLIGGSDYSGTPHIQIAKVDTSGSVWMNCTNCSGSGVVNTDEGTWVAGAAFFASTGGVFQANAKANPLTTSQFGTVQMTAYRAMFANLRDSAGNELNVSNPLPVSIPNLSAVLSATILQGRNWSAKSQSVTLAIDQPPIPAWERDSSGGDATDSISHSVVVSPYAPLTSDWRASLTVSDGAAHTLAAAGPSKIYVTGVQCFRTDTGTAMDWAILNDTAATLVALPPSGGSNVQLGTPLVVAANQALTFTVSAAVSSVTCSAQGYYAKG